MSDASAGPSSSPASSRSTSPAAEHAAAVPFLLGSLKLTVKDEAAIVAYLKTFTDTLTPKPPKPYK